jgi:DNA gyrase subunit B
MAENTAANAPGDARATSWPPRMTDHIRRRPGMHVGDTGRAGLHYLAEELIEYALAEMTTGHGTMIHVRLNGDGSVCVADDGRGIPVDMDPEAKVTTLEWVMTFSTWVEVRGGERVFRTSMMGAGARAVTALSDWAEAVVCRNGRVYRQRYERGLAVGDVCDTGPAGMQTGTRITFHPGPEIFHDAAFDRDLLAARLRELAFLNKGLITKFTKGRTGRTITSHYPGGVADFVEYLNRDTEPLHDPISVDATIDDVRVEVAMQYTTGAEERVRCYANNTFNRIGGTHLSGFRSAVTRTLNRYGRKKNLMNSGVAPTGEDLRQGLTAVVSVKLSDAHFESNQKLRLNTPEVEGVVAGAVGRELSRFLEENPEVARRIILKALASANARKAKSAGRSRTGKSGGLPE